MVIHWLIYLDKAACTIKGYKGKSNKCEGETDFFYFANKLHKFAFVTEKSNLG